MPDPRDTAQLPDREDAPTERRPPVDAEAPRAETEPPHLHDVTSTAGDYLRGRWASLTGLIRAHRAAAALAAVVVVAAVVAAVALAASGPDLPSEQLVSEDATARLETPEYSSGSFGWEDILVPREVEVRSISRDDDSGGAVAEVLVTYSGSHGVVAEKAATLRYAQEDGAWEATGEPEDVRVSWHVTEGVDESRVIENVSVVLERAERSLGQGEADEPTLAEIYAGAEVSVEGAEFDEEAQTESLELVLVREGAYERYECRIGLSLAFRSSSGQWEIAEASVSDGAKERSLEPLLGTWEGTFQSQETDGRKCLAAREAGLTVTISSVRGDSGAEQVTGTITGVAHYHAAPSDDAASTDGDAQLSEVSFTATLTEESDATLTFEGTLPEDVGGTVTLALSFGSAEDPSQVTARVTTAYVHEESFLFVSYDESATYTDLFSLVRVEEASQEE